MAKTPRLTKAAVLRALRDHDAQLKKFSVRRIGLFGSFVRDAQHRSSDLDFLVEFDQPTYDNFYGLSVYLEKLFRRKVDILTPDAVDSIRVPEVAASIRESVEYCLSAASCRRSRTCSKRLLASNVTSAT